MLTGIPVDIGDVIVEGIDADMLHADSYAPSQRRRLVFPEVERVIRAELLEQVPETRVSRRLVGLTLPADVGVVHPMAFTVVVGAGPASRLSAGPISSSASTWSTQPVAMAACGMLR